MSLTIGMETITPSIAVRMLEHNRRNRHLNDRTITAYAQAMRDHQWLENGDAIRFDTEGNLLDGQHRLNAIIKADATLPMLVIRGIDPAAQVTMDAGRKRTVADQLSIGGTRNATAIARVGRVLLLSEQLGLEAALRNDIAPGPVELLDYCDTHRRHVADMTGRATRFRHESGRLLPVATCAALWDALRQADPDEADTFMDGLATGANLPPDSPLLLLRKSLTSDLLRGRSTRTVRLRQGALTVKTWNAWHGHKPLRRLKWGGAEPFPHVSGQRRLDLGVES